MNSITNENFNNELKSFIEEKNLNIKKREDDKIGKIKEILYTLYDFILNFILENNVYYKEISENNFQTFLKKINETTY